MLAKNLSDVGSSLSVHVMCMEVCPCNHVCAHAPMSMYTCACDGVNNPKVLSNLNIEGKLYCLT